MDIRTDMAVEASGQRLTRKKISDGVVRTDIRLGSEEAKLIGRKGGRFITVESDLTDPKVVENAANALASAIKELMPEKRGRAQKTVLVVGLGNRNMTADALGNRVVENLIVTRQITELDKKITKLCALCPSVMGVTGIESYDIILGAVHNVSPDLVIAVDTLASSSTNRLNRAFQVTDTGITPGSGVANHRITLDSESLNVPVIAVGVPLVVYASTIVEDALANYAQQEELTQSAAFKTALKENVGDLIVTSKDIDIVINSCARLIALAINLAVHPKLSKERIKSLMCANL